MWSSFRSRCCSPQFSPGCWLRKVLFAAVRRWARNTDSHLDVLFVNTLRRPIMLWMAILGLHIATQNSEIPQRYLHYIPKTLQVLWGLSFTLVLSHLAGNMVRFYGSHAPRRQEPSPASARSWCSFPF